MSDTNRVALARVKESTFGVVPASPALQAVPFTSCGLLYDPDTVTSDRIRSDGQITDLILVGVNAGGPIADEFSYGVHDDDLEAVLRSAWVLKPQRLNLTADSVITGVAASSDTYTTTDTGADFAVGHLVVASGFTNAGNNSATPFRALSGSSGTAVVAPSSPGLTDEAAPPAGAKLQAVGFQGASGDLVAHGTAKTITSTLLDFTTLGLAVGEWVKPGNFAINVANNGFCRISGILAGTLSFDIVPAGWDDDAGTSALIKVFFGDYVRNGTTLSTYAFERRFLDHSPVTYEYFRGHGLDQLVINLKSKAKITVEKTYLGNDALVTTTRVTTPTDIAVPTGAILNSSANVGQLLEDDAPLGSPNYVMSAKITLKANLRRKPAISNLGCIGLGMGEFDAQIELNTYFGNKAIYDKLVSNESSSFMLPVNRPDENNRGYLFDFPRMKYAKGTPPVEGKNRDVMAPATAQAIMHETLLYTTHVQRFSYME